jgi:DNA-binding GntR family transcriptional regulator
MRDDVRDALLAMLLDGRLAAGASVSIDKLARNLGVSPTPVREALVEIEATGMVQRVAHRGYQVAPPMSAQQAAELADARLLVETEAARWAARLQDPDLLPQLRSAHRAHAEAAWAVHEWDGVTLDRNRLPVTLVPYFEADWSFHQTILDHCGNRFLRGMIGGLGVSMQRMRQSPRRGPLDADLAVAEHGRVLAAIEARDPEAAAGAMRAHIEAVRERSIADA